MIIYYHKEYNIDLGIINRLHPFDGLKFKKVVHEIASLPHIQIQSPDQAITEDEINEFADSLLKRLLHKRRFILRALELPYIPLIPFSWIDSFILKAMRWGVAGTLNASAQALKGRNGWNLAGGYHHASASNSEGFCIYNDIGITLTQLKKRNQISNGDKVLIIDIDAHHGNGNAYTFMEDKSITLLDIYNNDIYPQRNFSKKRVNINIPLSTGTRGELYLEKLQKGLAELTSGYILAFVVAGTDVLASDPLGGLALSKEDCIHRNTMVAEKLASLSIPFVFLGGGGYSKESAAVITESIKILYLH